MFLSLSLFEKQRGDLTVLPYLSLSTIPLTVTDNDFLKVSGRRHEAHKQTNEIVSSLLKQQVKRKQIEKQIEFIK